MGEVGGLVCAEMAPGSIPWVGPAVQELVKGPQRAELSNTVTTSHM